MQDPNFFIIGAARSGTTALAEMLRSHPDAFVTQPKEPHYLAFAGERPSFTGLGDEAMINRVAVTDHDAYLALYEGAETAAARGDASVSSLFYADEAVGNLRRRFPDARIVVILRDPVARAFSAYSYLRARGHEPCEHFSDAVEQEDERVELGWHHLWQYVGMGRYGRQLRVYLDAFPSEQIKVMFYEGMCADPAGAGRELFAFLGIDPSRGVATDRVNVSGAPRSATAQRALQWGSRQRRLRSAVKAVVPFTVRERIRRANLAQASASAEDAAHVRRLLETDTTALRELLDEHYPELVEVAPAWARPSERVAERVS